MQEAGHNIGIALSDKNLQRVAIRMLQDAGYNVKTISSSGELGKTTHNQLLSGLILDLESVGCREPQGCLPLIFKGVNIPTLIFSTFSNNGINNPKVKVYSASFKWSEALNDLKELIGIRL